eukprot:3013031-Pyramimonas_sp.AAC.1
MHIHDAVHRDHDKDFRCVALFPCEALDEVVLRVCRADHWGHLDIDTVLPAGGPKQECRVIIHRGHMRVLHPPSGAEGRRVADELIRTWATSGKDLNELPTMGWETYLASEEEGSP